MKFELKQHNDRATKRRIEVQTWLNNYKLNKGCIDCGYKEFPCALQLDHTGPKTADINCIKTSVRRIEEEIKNGKCEVRCANCHSVKTWREKQIKKD